jgi:hypothetical protein
VRLSRTVGILSLLSLAGVAALLLRPRTGTVDIASYRTLRIRPLPFRIWVEDPIPGRLDAEGRIAPVVGSYYGFNEFPMPGIVIDHYERRENTKRRIRYISITAEHDHTLIRTSKAQVLAEGDFGTVYLTRECFYSQDPNQYPVAFDVSPYSNQAETEPPVVHDQQPPDHSRTLTFVSVMTAIYAPAGELEGLHVNGSRNGDWLHPSFVGPFNESFTGCPRTPAQSRSLERFGLPDRFGSTLLQPDSASEVDFINYHYDFARWAQQDEYRGEVARHRYLTYAATPEDVLLDPPCVRRFEERHRFGS